MAPTSTEPAHRVRLRGRERVAVRVDGAQARTAAVWRRAPGPRSRAWSARARPCGARPQRIRSVARLTAAAYSSGSVERPELDLLERVVREGPPGPPFALAGVRGLAPRGDLRAARSRPRPGARSCAAGAMRLRRLAVVERDRRHRRRRGRAGLGLDRGERSRPTERDRRGCARARLGRDPVDLAAGRRARPGALEEEAVLGGTRRAGRTPDQPGRPRGQGGQPPASPGSLIAGSPRAAAPRRRRARWRSTSREPRLAEHREQPVGRGEVGRGRGRYAVRVPVGEQPADQRHDPAEVHARGPRAARRSSGSLVSRNAMRPPRPQDPRQSRRRRPPGRSRCAARTRTSRRPRSRRRAGAAARQPRRAAPRCARPSASRARSRSRPPGTRLRAALAEVARAAREVEHSASPGRRSSLTARRRHPTSIPNVITRFTRS